MAAHDEWIDFPISETWARHYRGRGFSVPEDLIRRRESLPTPQAHADDIARTLELYQLREEVAVLRAERGELERYVEGIESKVGKVEKRCEMLEQIIATARHKSNPPSTINRPIPIRPQGGVEL